jgi:catecholate siderophore receptor
MNSTNACAQRVALLATTALTLVLAAPTVYAQPSAKSVQVAQAEQAKSFAIPAGSLNDALTAFRLQSGMQVSADSAALRGVPSPGATGNMAPEEALSHVLAGTKFTFAVSGNAVTVVSQAQASGPVQLGPVRVEGQNNPDADPYADPDAAYKADRLSSSKFTEPVLDTPKTVTVLTKEALADQNATSLHDIGRSTAGVTLGSGEGGNAFGDRFFIRGFDARNDIFVDGVRDPGVSIRENFNTEQVEILRGPASSFAGRGTSGGAINIVTKRATDADFYDAEGTVGFSDNNRRLTFDVNKVIDPTLDVRLTGMIQNSNVAGRDFTTDNRRGIAGAVNWHPTDNFTLNADYSYTYLYGLPDFGVPYNQPEHRPATSVDVPRDTYYGIINRDFTRSAQAMGTLDARWQVNDWLTLENKARQSHSLLDYLGTTPENPSATNPATAQYSSTPTFNSGYVQLNAQSRYEPVTVLADQPQATITFDTGSIHHTAILGGEFSSEHLSLDSYSGFTSELTTGPVVILPTGAPVVSEYNPTHYLYGANSPKLTGDPLRYSVNTNAGYLMDTANYKDFIIVNGGIRFDDYNITARNNTDTQSAHSGLTSYNVGVVVKPTENSSIYAAYATAATPVGDELDATSSTYGGLSPTQPSTQIFGPQKSKAIELGVKWSLFDNHLLATGALFQTNVNNARETAPSGLPGYTRGQIVAGAAYRVQGVDFELAGKITENWSILGGLVLMDTKVTHSIVPTNVGLELANVAPQSFNLLTKYQLTPWLELGGQGIYSSEIKGGSLLVANGNVPYPGTPNPTIIPSHWRFDAFAETRITDNINLKLYAQNIFDKTYYDSFYQSAQPFIMMAPGRTISLIADVKF